MDLRRLRLFLAVVDEGGITRAAEAELVSQPSVSQAIRELETELGTPLFHRVGRGWSSPPRRGARRPGPPDIARRRDRTRGGEAVGGLEAGRLDLSPSPRSRSIPSPRSRRVPRRTPGGRHRARGPAPTRPPRGPGRERPGASSAPPPSQSRTPASPATARRARTCSRSCRRARTHPHHAITTLARFLLVAGRPAPPPACSSKRRSPTLRVSRRSWWATEPSAR